MLAVYAAWSEHLLKAFCVPIVCISYHTLHETILQIHFAGSFLKKASLSVFVCCQGRQ